MATYGTYNSPGPIKIFFYGFGILLAFFVMFQVVRDMYRDQYRGPVGSARAGERSKARRDLETKTAAMLNNPGWVNSNKAIVRLPIARAMELAVQGYENPEALRSNLITRVEKATAQAPPAPPQPSQFE